MDRFLPLADEEPDVGRGLGCSLVILCFCSIVELPVCCTVALVGTIAMAYSSSLDLALVMINSTYFKVSQCVD